LIDTVPDILARIVAREGAPISRNRSNRWRPGSARAELRLASRRRFSALPFAAWPAAIHRRDQEGVAKQGQSVSARFRSRRASPAPMNPGGAAALSVLTDEALFPRAA